MNLLIVESPGKLQKLREYLGAGWVVEASVGHVRDLPQKALGLTDDLRPVYELTERGRSVVKRLKERLKQCSDVYLATDPDREGEAIAWHLQEVLRLKHPKRCTFNEITSTAVRAAVRQPRLIDTDLVAAQEARRVLDRLVGYTVSPVLSDFCGARLSAGRVQTPAVRLVVDREREIRDFQAVQHFIVVADFVGGWRATWRTAEANPTPPHYCLDSVQAALVATACEFLVQSIENRTRHRNPPPPFTTSTLQQAASARLRLGPGVTMEAAQALYEHGAISYHRTDNPNLSAEGFAAVAAYAASRSWPCEPMQRSFKAQADAQAAHTAIVPTRIDQESAGQTPEQERLYSLVRARAIASQMPAAVYAVREAVLSAAVGPGGAQPVTFDARGETLMAPNWLALYADDTATDADPADDAANPIPALHPGQQLQGNSQVSATRTSAPKRYTQASLIKQLEAYGIGRPSTYAAIMSRIESAGYVATDKKLILSPTATAYRLIDSLVARMSFVEYTFTRQVERALDQVAGGKATFRQVITKANDILQRELHHIRAQIKAPACPQCGQRLMRRTKSGAYDFWGCVDYPKCKASFPDEAGKPKF